MQFVLFAYKDSIAYYPSFTLGPELWMTFFGLVIFFTKIKLANSAVSLRSKTLISLFIVLNVPLALLHFYLVFLQTYM